MGGGIPREAVGASVAVLTYSVVCLTCSTLLVCLLFSYGERWTYVTMICGFTVLSTSASIAQQIHYAVAWEVIKEAQYKLAVESLTVPALAFGGAAQVLDVVLFDIQFYCYNVMSLSTFFWSVSLFYGSWGIRTRWLGGLHEHMSLLSKIFAVVFPVLMSGLGHIKAIIHNTALFFFIANVTMLVSMSFGSILLVLILYKYMKTRRLLADHSRRGGWWAGSQLKQRRPRDIGADGTTESESASNTQRSIYDRALVTRFTIGFVILAGFEAAIIVFSLFELKNNSAIARSGGPNMSIANTISDILFFIPGVTTSLVSFLVFGTAKSWRQYRDMVFGCCGMRTRKYEKRQNREEPVENDTAGLEFERLPSVPNSPLTNSSLRLFPEESTPHDPEQAPRRLSSVPADRSSGQTPSVRNFQFHKPRPSPSWNQLQFSPAPTDSSTSAGIPSERAMHEDAESPV